MSSTMNFFTKKTKNSSFESEGTPNNEADDKSNCDGEQARSHFKKANSYPIAVMLFMAISLNIQIQPSESKELKCSSKQIAWKNKTTNRIESCMNCPECPPSQQYSIPCGMEAYIGTKVKCVDCPSGMYSENFDTKPCVSCNICTNKKVTQNCTSSQKSICVDCLEGYDYNHVTFSCMPTQATEQVTVLTTPPTHQPTTNQMLSTLPTTALPTTNSPATVPANSSSTQSTLIGVVLGTLSGAALVLIILGIVYFCKCYLYWRLCKGRPSCRRSKTPEDEEETIEMMTNEKRLGVFMYKNHNDAEKVYKNLCEKRHGLWDFERVAMNWPEQIKPEDLTCIKNQIHVDNGSPSKMLCDTLCSGRPQTTVREFANSLKDINKKAYNVLKPHFIEPLADVDNTDETASC